MENQTPETPSKPAAALAWLRADKKRMIGAAVVVLLLLSALSSGGDRSSSSRGDDEKTQVTMNAVYKMQQQAKADIAKKKGDDSDKPVALVPDIPSPYSMALKHMVYDKVQLDFSAEPKVFAQTKINGGLSPSVNVPFKYARKAVLHDFSAHISFKSTGSAQFAMIPEYPWTPGELAHPDIYGGFTKQSRPYIGAEADSIEQPEGSNHEVDMLYIFFDREEIIPHDFADKALLYFSYGDHSSFLGRSVFNKGRVEAEIIPHGGVDVRYVDEAGKVVKKAHIDRNMLAFEVRSWSCLGGYTLDYLK